MVRGLNSITCPPALSALRVRIDKNSWGAAKSFLKALITQFFGFNEHVQTKNLMGKTPMQRLAMCRLTAEQFGETGFRLPLPTALLGGLLALDGAFLRIIALRIIGPALTIKMPLETTNFCVVSDDLCCKLLQCRLRLSDDSSGGGADIQAQCFGSERMLKCSGFGIKFFASGALHTPVEQRIASVPEWFSAPGAHT